MISFIFGNEIISMSKEMKAIVKSRKAKVVLYQNTESEILVEIWKLDDSDEIRDSVVVNSYASEEMAEEVAKQISNYFYIPLDNRL